MNKIVWVFGCSASGKETFIKEALKGNKIIDDLGWDDYKVIPINESMEFIKQSEDDLIELRRPELIDRVVEESANNSNAILLLKGQNYDFKYNLVDKLKERVPNAEHLIIFLHTDLNTCFARMKQKSWYVEEEDGNIEDMKDHMIESANLVLASGLPIIAIDTTNGYTITNFPNYDIIFKR